MPSPVLNNIIDKEGTKSYDFKYVKKMRADLKEDHEYYKNDEQKGLIKPQKFLYDLRK